MYLVILSLAVGLVIGSFLQFDIPPEFARYTAVAIIGILDSLFGAIRASVENKYDTTVFLTGLGFNMGLAVLITFFGDKLNLDLYLAILVAFMIRILANIGQIKTATLTKFQKKVTEKPI
jgi:small basic protein